MLFGVPAFERVEPAFLLPRVIERCIQLGFHAFQVDLERGDDFVSELLESRVHLREPRVHLREPFVYLREPVAYLRGLKEFYGLAFETDARALIPRPETERLVELAQAEVMRRLGTVARPVDAPPLRIVDVGTGSGAIAVSLAVSLRRLRALEAVEILAVDISPDALGLARENSVGHAVAERIAFAEADLLPADAPKPFDVVLANLPYVRTEVIATLPRATSFEPIVALDGGADGLAVIERLLDRLPEALAGDGVALLEIGADQGEAIVERVDERLPGWECAIETDLAGLPRVARIARGGASPAR
jgi:release factor glutamine methyltransferase